MPEGDVLRLTAERLDQALRGRPLVRAELRWPGTGGTDLTGRTVTGCVSYGKHLLTRFDDGRTLHTHLRMEGSWRVVATSDRAAAARHPEVRAVLATARWTCVGWRLGMLDLLRTHDEPRLLAHLGPDVLGADFGTAGLTTALDRWHRQGDRPLCDVLLDQSVVAGLGTIWMAESLFDRRLHPWAPADSLDDEEVRALLVTARRLVGRSVDVGRREGLGEVPRAVHGKLGHPCRRCRTPVAVGQANEPPYERPVFWCPTCQAVSRPA
ncbi:MULTISPECIES: DNA-formamidopyrimidine glycosylase family protein [Isoptericola]|uniref:DNA-(apurinic or apyrimidinic site) lyase n=1 Tax=Isoptericola sediminis TaxID=2733572 RepID=A0A849JY57_9MICO|nr:MULTISPECIES: DNA-formamidopyrimidine glycosylase family protein [Isoptericola]MDO8151945.1 DNA-formamidopyrimidine glycosylase family protein [Isoptericola sp. b408]NNU28242.1 Fpg/Nei family DNA glycosylase [Isoptericola sediminis]